MPFQFESFCEINKVRCIGFQVIKGRFPHFLCGSCLENVRPAINGVDRLPVRGFPGVSCVENGIGSLESTINFVNNIGSKRECQSERRFPKRSCVILFCSLAAVNSSASGSFFSLSFKSANISSAD